jgi:replicative DNA helicase
LNAEPPADFKQAARKPTKLADRSAVDRLPPHSIEAEQGILGCVLLSPQECVGQCIEQFKAGSEVFYDLRHRAIYELVVKMFDGRKAIDLITLQQELRDAQQLDGVGGLGYLASLPDSVPSAANLGYYVDIVLEKFILRRMIGTCADVIARAYDHQGEVDQLLDQVERDILTISQTRETGALPTISDLVHGAIGRIEQYHQNGGALSGLATGFPDLDKMTTGLHAGEMIVIAARPSLGKTSLACCIAETVAIDQKQPVAIFSLEMTADSLVLRMLCSRARVNLRNITSGFLAERDFPRLTGAAGKLNGAPLYIDDTAGLSILQLRAKARRLHQQHGIKLFVIDYLQLLHSDNRRADNRQQEIADISGGVKALAKELSVPVIVLAQLNREVEREKRKPRLSDLRESGAIEQDADLVGILYRPESEEEEQATPADVIPVNLLIAKQRNGPTGDVHLTFIKGLTRFESAAKISGEDYNPSNP